MEIVESPQGSADWQMEQDAELIESLVLLKKPLVRFYSWRQKTITYGYFIDPNRVIDCASAERAGYEVARRPTGGGLLFHDNDFSFTVALGCCHPAYSSQVLENYRLINGALIASVRPFIQAGLVEKPSTEKRFSHLCMASPTEYDPIWNGKKIGGAAARRTRHGFVHQSSLFLQSPDWQEIETFWKGSKEELEAMKAVCGSVLDSSTRQVQLELRSSFQMYLEQALDSFPTSSGV